jgi:hypothetical protein
MEQERKGLEEQTINKGKEKVGDQEETEVEEMEGQQTHKLIGTSDGFSHFQKQAKKLAKAALTTKIEAPAQDEAQQLEALKQLTGNRKLRQLPRKSKPHNRRHVVINSLLPALKRCWGLPSVIVADLASTPEFQPVFKQSLVGTSAQYECNAVEARQAALEEIQQRMDDVSLLTFFGTGQSNEGWEKKRRLHGFESRSAAVERTKNVKQRRAPPNLLAGNELLCERIINHVTEKLWKCIDDRQRARTGMESHQCRGCKAILCATFRRFKHLSLAYRGK